MHKYERPVETVCLPKALFIPVVGIPDVVELDFNNEFKSGNYNTGILRNRLDINLSYLSKKSTKLNTFVNTLFQLKDTPIKGDCYIILIHGDRTAYTINTIHNFFINREMLGISMVEEGYINDITMKAMTFKEDTPAYAEYLENLQLFNKLIKNARHTLQSGTTFMYDRLNCENQSEVRLSILNIDPDKKEEIDEEEVEHIAQPILV